MANNTSIPIIVQGNSYTLSIPLQVYYVDDDEMVLRDYTPELTDKVVVQLKGERRSYTYTPTIDGSTALVELAGTELADRYAVMVSIIKDNGQRLRSYRTDQFFIVESSDDLTPADIIEGLEENVIYLNSSIFVAGEQGEQGEQGVGIASIAKTATSGLVDTYTITLTNGNTYTFTVTNGEDGHDLGLATIINNLNSDSTDDALSAAMGKELKGMIDNIDVSVASGTFASAMVKAFTTGGIFEWLLEDNATFKPMWHIGDNAFVDAVGAEVFIATLAVPAISEDSGEVAEGTQVTITCPSGSTLYYKVNNTTSTSTSNVTLTINSNTNLSVFVVKNNECSEIASRTYTVANSGITLTASAPTTMTLDGNTYNLVAGENIFDFTTLGGRTFASIAFGDKTVITKADFGGATINDIASLFRDCTDLTECVNLNVNGSCIYAFSGCSALTKVKIGGATTNMRSLFSACQALTDIDVSNLGGSPTIMQGAFQTTTNYVGTIDLRNIDTSSCTSFSTAFRSTRATKLIIGNFTTSACTSDVALFSMFSSTTINTLQCTSSTPPVIKTGYNWLEALATACSWQAADKPIKVPSGALSAYQSAAYWSDYATYMEEIS